MGFPTADDFAEALGVSPEDRDRWRKRDESRAAKPETTAKAMVREGIQQAIGLAEMGIKPQLYGHQFGAATAEVQESEARRPHTIKRIVTETTQEVPSSDGPSL